MARKSRTHAEFDAALGGTIRRHRENMILENDKRLTMDVFIERAGFGLARGTLSGIEHGKQQMSAYQLYIASKALGVSADDLLREAVSKIPSSNSTNDMAHEDISITPTGGETLTLKSI